MASTPRRHSRSGGLCTRSLLFLVLSLGALQGGFAQCNTTADASYRVDYRDQSAAKVWLINDITQNHCNANVQSLKGNIHGNPRFIMDDIHYTLERVPNHRPCLAAVMKYQSKKGYPFYPNEAHYPTAECYLLNARQVFPDDYFVVGIMGVEQYNRGHYEQAAKTFESVLEKQPKNAEVLYNLGLTYFAMKDYPRAAKSAEQSYGLGFPLPGLKRKLIQVGAWPPAAAN